MADTWLITGGAGFIGSNLVRKALARAGRVRVLDNFLTGFRENIAEVLPDIELIEGDIRDADVCRRACQGAETVFHQAALPSVPRSMKDPQTSVEVNVTGTFNVLMAARDRSVRRFIYAASSSAYGALEDLPKRETMPVLPISPYAAAKACGELLVAMFHRAFGLETVSLRYFNVFGPWQDPSNQYAGVIAAFASRMLRGEQPIIYGDGTQSRDFTYVQNVVQANLLAADAPALRGEVVNIGCGQAIDLNHMVKVFNDILRTDLEPVYAPPRPGDVKHSLAEVSAAGRLLDYKPQVLFPDGLRQTIDWYREAMDKQIGGWAKQPS